LDHRNLPDVQANACVPLPILAGCERGTDPPPITAERHV
jgi:hypothetical protein